ncbi:Hypothetical protein SmN45_0025 [Serratia marcescens]|nr:Hypothetical protein SmN45_0025 [Serratia marcescens]
MLIYVRISLYFPRDKVAPMLFLLILSTKKLPSSRDNVIKCRIISYYREK